MPGFDDELDAMVADVHSVLNNVTITVRSRSGGTFPAMATGTSSGRTVGSWTGEAIRRPAREETSPMAGHRVRVQEISYLIDADELSSLTLKEGITVLDGSTELAVHAINRPAGGHGIELLCRSDRRPQ